MCVVVVLRVWDEVTMMSVLWVWVWVVVEKGRSHSLLSHYGVHCVLLLLLLAVGDETYQPLVFFFLLTVGVVQKGLTHQADECEKVLDRGPLFVILMDTMRCGGMVWVWMLVWYCTRLLAILKERCCRRGRLA